MSDRWQTWKRDARNKARDWLDRWRALPRGEQWKIAGGLSALAAVCLALALWSVLSRGGTAHAEESSAPVVLYTSVDSNLVAPIVEEFEKTTGIHVKVVGDTEATKTTGLVARLIAERAKPRADVWWSSDPMGTVSLAHARILEPFVSREEAAFKQGWPKELRAKDKTWYGFGQRARVIAYNTNRLAKVNAPVRLRDLTQDKWAGKVGMARPQFGTTRTQIAALIAAQGEKPVREWLDALKTNGLKLYDGNSSVVHALSVGEIEVGLTDTDDVWAAQRENWPVDLVFEAPDKPGAAVRGLASAGPLVMPNTVGKISGAPHPNEATRLSDFLLSARVEEMLAQSESRNIPIRAELLKKFDQHAVPSPAQVDAAEVAAALDAADRLINEMFPIQ